MRIDGACHCGFITYEANVDPDHVGVCHCTDCQMLSGTAFRTYVLAPGDDFRILSGQPKLYVKTSESGAKRVQAFCPECGTPIYSSAPNDPRVFSIRLGTARQRDGLIPRRQIWSRSAQTWLRDIGTIERFAEQPPLRLWVTKDSAYRDAQPSGAADRPSALLAVAHGAARLGGR